MLWIILIAVAWLAAGFSSMLWLSRGYPLTWGGLLVCVLGGVFRPLIWLVIGIVILCQADFWQRPIFPQRPPPPPPLHFDNMVAGKYPTGGGIFDSMVDAQQHGGDDTGAHLK